MVVTSLMLLVAAGVSGGVALFPTSDVKNDTTPAVVRVMEQVLSTVAYSDYSISFLTDGFTSASTVYKLVDQLRIPGGVGIFEVAGERPEIQLSLVIDHIKRLRELTSHTTVLVISDDPAFLAAFAEWSLKGRLLVWSTRLLAVTRLTLSELHPLHRAFSKSNAMLLIFKDESANIRCNMYVHLPYSPKEAKALKVATWTPRQGLTLTTHLQLFPNKFSKPTLLAASEVNPFNKIITIQDAKAPGGQRSIYKGPVPELMAYLAKGLNFSYTYVRPPNGFWGAKLSNGSWVGMVGMVKREEVSIGVGPFIFSGQRAEVVDFTVPILIDYWRILGVRGRPTVDPWSFLFPLAPLVWAAILAALVMLPAVVFLMSSCFFPKKEYQENWILVIFGYSRILLQQDILVPVDLWWERVMLAVWMLTTLVLTRSYAGNLMSLLAVRHILEPYQSRRVVLDDPSVTMIWERGSAVGRYLSSVKSGIYREIAEAEKEGRLIWRTHKQFAGDIDTLVRRGDHVLMEVDSGLKAYVSQDFGKTGECSFYESKEEFLPLMFGMIGPKDSPLIPALNKRITSMTEAGLFFQWLKTDEPNSTVCYRAPTKITVKSTLSLTNTWGMFVVIVTGHTFSLLVLCLELLSHQR
ncbi:probable glutamate receptor isoform X2 [Homarus americanus]|uniref:probable glutamate receptor isoform X2 n=1 Tax=Homarus americanus TaxID=6706 RepID=UPI001C47EA27|nr:probable glutamate receptor isoform X2 [Homarus americanus]